MSLLDHVVDFLHVFPDVLIVIVVVMVRQESLNLQFLFQLHVQNFGFMQQLGVNVVSLTVFDFTVDVFKCM